MRNAPLKAFCRQQHKQCISQNRTKKRQIAIGRGVCGNIIPFSFDNYLVISTVTYSFKIYTPNLNVKNLRRVRVQLTGEEFMETERKTVIDPANRPETETRGYVKYQTLEIVFYHRERR